MKKQTFFVCFLVFALIASLLCGCAKSAELPEAAPGEANGYYSDKDFGYVSDMEVSTDSASGSTSAKLPQNRKLIRTVRIEAESENMDELLTSLEQKLTALGGYVENREMYNNSGNEYRWRSAQLTLRIPSDQADTFLTQVEDDANVTSLNESMEDVTLDYIDTESRILALETEQARLLELMEQAETLSDLLEIEARLTDVRYELESYASQLRLYDNLIDYTTIHLTLRQVTTLTPTQEQTVWQRIGTGFVSTLEGLGEVLTDIFVWLIVASPVLVLLAIPVTVVLLLLRARRKKKKAKAAPPQSPAE